MAEEEVTKVVVEPPPPLGMFIRGYLLQHREGSPTEIHQEYKNSHRGAITSKGRPYKLGTYRSQLVYIRSLARIGLLERSGRVEDGNNPIGDPIREDLDPKVYFRLTSKGRNAPEYVWAHPLRLWYKPFSWEYDTYGNYIKP